MLISGLQKLTLLDYPEKTACTIFTYGCNFRCPFCHNALLVTEKCSEPISEDEILAYLKKRQGILDGVCITGGEPTLQKDLIPFMEKIKDLGYSLKLDTNGYRPELLEEIFCKKLCDYVAMDVKNSLSKYSLTTGCEINTDIIKESIKLIKDASPDFEFRTTVVREFHTHEDLAEICELVGSESKIYFQQFKDSGNLICGGLSPWSDEEMAVSLDIIRKSGFNAFIRKS